HRRQLCERDSHRNGRESGARARAIQVAPPQAGRRLRHGRGSHHHSHAKNPAGDRGVRAVRWLRFVIGLLIALTLHSLLDSFFPNALAFFNPYVILVVYYSMGGNILGAIIAGVTAGLVQDAFSGAIFGLHAFSLTVCASAFAYINSRLVLRGTLFFGACLAGAVIINELVIYILINILLKQKIEMFEQGLIVKTIFTLLFGMLVYQILLLFLREEHIEATKRPAVW